MWNRVSERGKRVACEREGCEMHELIEKVGAVRGRVLESACPDHIMERSQT